LISARLSHRVRTVAMPPHTDQAQWFTKEVHPHDAHLRAYLRGAFPAVRDVDDVVQESYLRIWRVGPGGRLRSARAFLFRVARNIALDFLRERDRAAVVPGAPWHALAVADDQPDAAEAAGRQERIDRLAVALNRLPPRQREVLVHCKLYGRSYGEVAALLGLSEKTITEHVYRGMQRLSRELGGGETQETLP
jgi:RNA polymerase sigma-70 factor (ECF subfamily)